MADIVLYFQMHQPHRLARITPVARDALDRRAFIADDRRPAHPLFDDVRNIEITRAIAQRCYRPALGLLLDLIHRGQTGSTSSFRFALSCSGVLLEQLENAAPDVLHLLRELAATGSCEFLGETYYHSLASLASHPVEGNEFAQQIDLHAATLKQHLGVIPSIFRNTELIYSDQIAVAVASMRDASGAPRFRGMLAEGHARLIPGSTPACVHRAASVPAPSRFGVLLRNDTLSDDIAFRFRAEPGGRLDVHRFVERFGRHASRRGVIGLFMDLETFGEHHPSSTGIFEFLDALPEAIRLAPGGPHRFIKPSDALSEYETEGTLSAPTPNSWADASRDTSAWLGNAMQKELHDSLWALEQPIKSAHHAAEVSGLDQPMAQTSLLLRDWRRLTTSDHLYYLSTKGDDDGNVHRHFSAYASPYDACVNLLHAVDRLKSRLQAAEQGLHSPPNSTLHPAARS